MFAFLGTLTKEEIKREIARFERKAEFRQKKENRAERQKRELRRCLSYLQTIRTTHSLKTTPPHTSEEYLLFFIGEDNKPALIEELSPPEEFMPEMQRISSLNAKRQLLKTGEEGFLLQRVYFGINPTVRTSARFVICLTKMLVEEMPVEEP